MDESKEKRGSVSIVKESSVTVSETVVAETMVSEDQIRIEEGGEAGCSNGDDVMVEVLGSNVYVDGICITDGGDGGVVRGCSKDAALRDCDESGEGGSESNPRTFDSECDAAGSSGGEAKAQIEVNGDVIRACSNDEAVCGRDESYDLGSRNEGGEAKAQNDVNGTVFEGLGAPGSSAVSASSGMDKNEGHLNHATETRKVGDLVGNELNHENQNASEDSSVQAKDVEEDLNTLDGAHETLSEPIKKAADVDVDATSLDVKTQVTAEGIPDSEAKDPVYSSQPTESAVEGQLDEKGKEIDKQSTDSEQQQMEVKTPHRSTENHDTGAQCLKPKTVIDGEEGADLNTAVAMHVEKQISDAKNAGFEAEEDVKVEASKADNNILNQISDTVASDKVLQSSGNEDQLAKNVDSEDYSSVGQDMNVVEEQVTGDEPDNLEQVEDMEVEERDSDSEELTNVDERTVKQTDLKSVSAVKAHQAKYQLPSEKGEFSVSDLVWGKVRSLPWWPGQIFDPSDSSEKAVKHHKKDSFLVAYFGDRTFAWNEASLMKPFRTHYSQIEKQSNLESFQDAVDCALEEVRRRVELGLACSCIPQDVYDKIKFQKVENAGVCEESSLKDGVDISLSASFFEPDKLVDYMKALAESPSGGGDRLDLVIAKAQLLAFYCLKGYRQLPEFQFSEEKTPEVVECTNPMDTDGEQISETPKTRKSYLKRKHNLKDVLYPSKKNRNLSELLSETFDSPECEIRSDWIANKPLSSSFDKKRKDVDSSDDSSLPKVSPTTPNFPKPSFKIGERIRRAASQMTTRSPSILKSSSDRLQKVDGGYDFPVENIGDAEPKRMDISIEYSSLDELLSRLLFAACDPMKIYSLNIIIGFFSDFRDSMVLDQLSWDKARGKRKKSPNCIISSSETFEFEDMSDTYWTDRVVQNGSEEQLPLGTYRGQYQIVPVELEKPIQKGRKSRKRYADVNHDLTAQKPPGYVDEKAPAEIVMNFYEINSTPSEAKLNKMFKHFGPLKESETEVDRETSRARVVFRRSADAEVAYNSAGKFNIFGQVSVTYQLNYTISESFKASLYAPTLAAEENPFIASTPCGDHAIVPSTFGEETSLLAPSLGEEASFMVSTLGEDTLPVATSIHEAPSFIASTVAEDTLTIPTTFADGTSIVATTIVDETLPITLGEDTLSLPAAVNEETSAVPPTIPETLGPEMQTIPTTLGQETPIVHTTLGEESPSIASASGEESHSIPSTSVEETRSIPSTLVEETRSIPSNLDEETRSIPSNLDEEFPTDTVTLTEVTPSISGTLGEETPSVPVALSEETPAITLTFGEETPAIPPSSSEAPPTFHTTLHEETQTTPTTLAVDSPTIIAKLDEESLRNPKTLDEETPTSPTNLAEETSTIPTTSSVEASTDLTSNSRETSAVPMEVDTLPPAVAENLEPAT